jgi:hypothetical protein
VTLRDEIAMEICLAICGTAAHRSDYFGEADAAILALRQWLADQGLVIVPAEPTPRMFEANSKCTSQELWAGIGWAAMIAAAPDALKAPDPAPPSPGAITGIRMAEAPCSDCIDGWCQMNCGPRVG